MAAICLYWHYLRRSWQRMEEARPATLEKPEIDGHLIDEVLLEFKIRCSAPAAERKQVDRVEGREN